MKKLMVRLVVLTLAVTVLASMNGSLLAQGRGAPVPPAPAPLADLVNKLVDAINKQDAATIQKMIAPDAVYLDEDGHAPGIQGWVAKLTTGSPKQLMISASHGQLWDDAGWVSFNYSFMETVNAKPTNIKGTADIVVKKSPSGDWLIQLVHGALEQHIAGFTQ